ncbi:MAG TPA: hypothetical protein VG028_12910 [Terriglobia bacterium]|nr:hypothetical protein [Terriglobia bacterium]
MHTIHYPQIMKSTRHRADRLRTPTGVALILVLLAMLVLSVLAASIVFTARSETFASYNYKLDTQADYLAKAGIQRAVNWLRSSEYYAASPTQANTYYNVTPTDPKYPNLYTSDQSPVQCKTAALGGCPTAGTGQGSIVQFIGYGNGTGLAGSSSNYPTDTIGPPVLANVVTKFKSDLNDPAFTANRISGDAANSGYYTVDATMLNYQTVNVTPPPTDPHILASCVTSPNPSIDTCPMETWLITAKATWTGPSSATATVATAEESAIIQPIYWPTWGNALYGFCSVGMPASGAGNPGICTNSYNSSLGSYGSGTTASAAAACGVATGNVIDTGAGVGSNGGVTVGSNVSIGGNVTIGSNPPAGCGQPAGCTGCSSSNVSGEVVNGPPVPVPPLPNFPPGPPKFPGSGPGAAPGATGGQTLPDPLNWVTLNSTGNYVAGTWPFPLLVPAIPVTYPTMPASPGTVDCMTGQTCNGTATNPYLLGTVTLSTGILNIVGGSSPLNPVYYDMDQLTETGTGQIVVSGYVVLNVQTSMTIKGNGIAGSGIGTEVPPAGVQINYAGTNPVAIGGNGAVCALITAPRATVTLKGGGSKAYMIGAIQALNIDDSGGYPVHYDIQLAKAGGVMGTMVSTAYSRRKM